jgi:alanyl-tRNA synthetase
MTTHDIRRRYREYFERQGHLALPSSSLIPAEDDATVLLTIAGMQPLKQYFLGTATPPATRATSCQKCFRTPDIDQVGRTARHLTFFEMLGNFSFGDYFKKDAIRFGFEVSTEVFGFDPKDIWITVFEGMPGVPADEEAVEYWVEMGIARERIQALGDPDNFWKLGPTGPCGPNTELYIDRGPAFGPEGGPATGTDRFLEYWNLVFMQYDRGVDGALNDLPAQNVDTGAGLERIAALIQDTPSVFETDAFWPLIEWAQARSGRKYGTNARDDRALRVMADHGRGMTFLATDGVRPGNEGRDYILRRIVRRAMAEASSLGLGPQDMPALAEQVAQIWGDAYPELRERASVVADVIGVEAEQFARTLTQGKRLLDQVIAESGATVSGDDAFKLHDTFGFPLDLTLDAAEAAGASVDTVRFETLMDQQRDRARKAQSKETDVAATAAAAMVSGTSASTTFVGYDTLIVETAITQVETLDDGQVLLRIATSPFYAQGGGQVSDTGTLVGPDGVATVTEVYRVGDEQVLRADVVGTLRVGDTAVATVDPGSRRATQGNHTATHLLHWALREAFGTSTHQAGSYVGPDKLRFDFTLRERMGEDQRAAIEAAVNARIAEDAPVGWQVMTKPEADATGAIGLFGEKYGANVRVVSAGDYSKELCGGTHVSRTGEIGAFKILSEGGIGSGTRRIEAVTGEGVIAWYRDREAQLEERLAERETRIKQLEHELKSAKTASVDAASLAADAQAVGAVALVVAQLDDVAMDELLVVSDQIKSALGPNGVIVLGSSHDGKAVLVATAARDAVETGISAGDIIAEIAPLVGGGGGGRPNMARAGGKDPSGLPRALDAARAHVAGRAG